MRRTTTIAAAVAVAMTLAAGATPAHAELTLVPGSFAVTASNSGVEQSDLLGQRHMAANPADLAVQAGAHPAFFTTAFTFASRPDPSSGVAYPGGNLKEVTIDYPAGSLGDPTATPRCTQARFAHDDCPPDTQVGVEQIDLGNGPTSTPVYNLTPSKGSAALLGFTPFMLAPVYVELTVRDGRLRATLRGLTQALPVISSQMTLWGDPADSSHDGDRRGPTRQYGAPSGLPRRPFLSAPTSCTPGPLTSTLTVTSWQQPDRPVRATSDGPPMTGCDRLAFAPSLTVVPDTTQAGAPVGLRVDVGVPQSDAPDGLAAAHVRKVVATLPPGVAISPSAANGLEGCADDRFGRGEPGPATCPDRSKIGTATVRTPLLDEPLTGAVFLGQPLDRDPRSGRMFRVFVEVAGPGVRVKLLGAVVADPATGRLTATFDDTPQLPFSSFSLAFAGGPLAPLANPTSCGTATTAAKATAWAGLTATTSDSYTVTGCERRFEPTFTAGTVNPVAGSSSPFVVTFGREDRDRPLRAIATTLPRGLLARISRIDQCPAAAATTGACGPSAQIGTVRTAAGPGPSPFTLHGRVYLTGPYRGAPFGLAIVVPAVAGPFDLGTVVVRAAIDVDPSDAHLRIVSDPLPTILGGIPLNIRQVALAIDRAGFMVNPTDCAPSAITAAINSVDGDVRAARTRFQVGDCARLRYTPKLSLTVGRRGATPRRGARLPLTAVLTQPAGQANNKVVETVFPTTINSRLAGLRHQCASMAAFLADRCDPRGQVGTARATTPLLRGPLRGPIYFVRSPTGRLPTMMIALRGEGVRLNLRGDIAVRRSFALRVRIKSPDAPVTRFSMTMSAGPNAPLGVAVPTLCAASARARPARIGFRAHSDTLVRANQRLTVLGCTTGTSSSRARSR